MQSPCGRWPSHEMTVYFYPHPTTCRSTSTTCKTTHSEDLSSLSLSLFSCGSSASLALKLSQTTWTANRLALGPHILGRRCRDERGEQHLRILVRLSHASDRSRLACRLIVLSLLLLLPFAFTLLQWDRSTREALGSRPTAMSSHI